MPVPARNAGKPWSSSEEEELIRNVQQYRGDIRAVAEVHGRSGVAINMRIASIIRRMVNAEGMDPNTVANLFFKSPQEMEEVLSPKSQTSSSTTKRPSMTQTVQEMEQDLCTVLIKVESMEKMLRKISKKLGITSTSSSSTPSSTTPKKKKKKKKTKKKVSIYDEQDD